MPVITTCSGTINFGADDEDGEDADMVVTSDPQYDVGSAGASTYVVLETTSPRRYSLQHPNKTRSSGVLWKKSNNSAKAQHMMTQGTRCEILRDGTLTRIVGPAAVKSPHDENNSGYPAGGLWKFVEEEEEEEEEDSD